MLRTLTIFIAATFLFFCSIVRAEEAPIPPTPSRWVTDTVGFLSTETQQALDKRLEQYEKTSGMKVAIWIGTTAGDAALETWAQNAVNAWKAQQKAFGNGIVMFILTQDRAIDVEVAPGLESRMSDQFVAQMIFEQMAPQLDKGDANGALTAAVDTMLKKLDMPAAETNTAPQTPQKSTKPMQKPADDTAKEPTDDSAEKPAESKETARKPSVLLLVALGALVILSTIAIGAVTLSQRPKTKSKQ